MSWRGLILFPAVVLTIVFAGKVRAENTGTSQPVLDSSDLSSKERLIGRLPDSIGDGLDFSLWGWLGGYHNDQDEYSKYYDAEVGVGITRSFDQRFTVSGQGNFIDANGNPRGELEQGYISAILDEGSGTYLTIGKFNANFGTESRDFWSRTTGTTSLLFGAQPQDLVGGMLTLPVGKTSVTLKPFISEDFQGQFDFNQCPSAGLMTEYEPVHGINLAATGWVGPGFVLSGGHSIQSPYAAGDYGDGGSNTLIANWQGPNLRAQAGGTLYFVEAKANWQATQDLQLAAGFLQGTTGTKLGRWGWFGFMIEADYNLTDRWRLFGQFSFLDDTNWLITGTFQRVYEYSIGTGYDICKGVEVRGEYRHDESNATGNSDTVSIHLALTY